MRTHKPNRTGSYPSASGSPRYVLGGVLLAWLPSCGADDTERYEERATSRTSRQTITLQCPTERSTQNRKDDHPGEYQIQPLYVLPKDAASGDEYLDIDGRICNSVKAFSNWFASQTVDGSVQRLDTFDGNVLDIRFVELDRTEAYMMGSTCGNTNPQTDYVFLRDRLEAELASLIEPNKIYAVYYGGTSPFCGGGAFPPNLVGHVAAMYLKDADVENCPQACPDDIPFGDGTTPVYLDYAMLHEILHTQGFVDIDAPNAEPNPQSGVFSHVCEKTSPPGIAPARDLMYGIDHSRPECTAGWATFHPDGLILDINRDDYYDHGRADLPDLRNSIFLDPLPATPELPPGWDGPCSALCPDPVPFEAAQFHSGSLGTSATCHETTASLEGVNCGNFAPGRSFRVNGAPVVCDHTSQPLPASRNGGYCLQASAGNHSWAYFATW